MAPNHWTTDPEYIELLNYLIKRTKNVESPMSRTRLAIEFKEASGAAQTVNCLRQRIRNIRESIHSFDHIDKEEKVKLLFALSSSVDAKFLKELKRNAVVKVNDEKQIIHYKANDGNLELRGDHSQSGKIKSAMHQSERSLRSLIRNYFENKNAVLMNEEEKEMGNLIDFITKKCENIKSPLCFRHLVNDFNNHFRLSRSFSAMHLRIRRYCHEIQKAEFLDIPSKVKQLFGLSATLDSDYLEKFREDAVVEVDDLNRITKYTANDGPLILHGFHSLSAKNKLGWIARRTNRKTVKKHYNFVDDGEEESEKEDGYSEDDSDEYSNEEIDSEFDSDDENDHLDETEDHMESSNRIDGFDDEKNDSKIGEHLSYKTRSGRLSKKRNLGFSGNQTSSGTNSSAVTPAKLRKKASEQEQASNSSSQSRRSSRSMKRSSRNTSFSTFSTRSEENMENQDELRAEEILSDYHRPRNQEMEDYDYNPREANTPESLSINNRIGVPEQPSVDKQHASIEAQNTHKKSDAVTSEPHPDKESLSLQNETNSTSQTNGKEVIPRKVPVKVENEEPIIVEDHPEDVKPVTAHNSKIKFFEAMKSLILFLDTPSLSDLQSKILKKIRKMKGSKEVLQNNELMANTH